MEEIVMTEKSNQLFKELKGFQYQFTLQDVSELMIERVYFKSDFYAIKNLLINNLHALTGKTKEELKNEYDLLFDERFPVELADLAGRFGHQK